MPTLDSLCIILDSVDEYDELITILLVSDTFRTAVERTPLYREYAVDVKPHSRIIKSKPNTAIDFACRNDNVNMLRYFHRKKLFRKDCNDNLKAFRRGLYINIYRTICYGSGNAFFYLLNTYKDTTELERLEDILRSPLSTCFDELVTKATETEGCMTILMYMCGLLNENLRQTVLENRIDRELSTKILEKILNKTDLEIVEYAFVAGCLLIEEFRYNLTTVHRERLRRFVENRRYEFLRLVTYTVYKEAIRIAIEEFDIPYDTLLENDVVDMIYTCNASQKERAELIEYISNRN